MSEWIDRNEKYLKGWGSYMLIVFAFHVLIRILGVGSFLSLPFQAIGVSDRVADSIGWGICGLASLVVAFYALRSAVMKRILVLAFIIITGAYLLTFDPRNERAFRDLIDNSSTQTITRLTLKLQQREVECSDKEILAILLDLMRHGEPASFGGTTYDATLVINNGRRLGCLMYFNEQNLSVSVGGGLKNFGDNINLLNVGLPRDLPRNFQVLLDFLLASHESVGGTRLILEDGGNITKTKM